MYLCHEGPLPFSCFVGNPFVGNIRLLVRSLGEKDKRQMFFTLTDKAKERLEDIRKHGIEIPDLLFPFFQ